MENREKIGLGTVQFGLPYGISNKAGQTPAGEVAKILATAKSYKIDTLDSASAYGNSEEVLGHHDLSSFKMVSKFMPASIGGSLSLQFEDSLKKLGLEFLYGYLAHRPMDILKHPEQWEDLQNLKEAGKLKKIGFSLNEPEELEQLLEKGFFPDLVQVPFNYCDRRFEVLIKDLKNKGCEIHTRSSFLQGLFFIAPEKLDGFFGEIKPILKDIQKTDALNGALLKFVLETPFIDKVIIGVETETQLVENMENIKTAPNLPKLEQKITENILNPSKWPKN